MIRGALPQYEPGIAPLQILLLGTFFSSVPRGFSSFFITLRRQAQTVYLYVAAIIINFTAVWYFIHAGYGLTGAAIGTTSSLALFGIALTVLAMRYFTGLVGILRFLAHLLWPLLLGVSLVGSALLASGVLVGPEPTVVRLATGGALYSWRTHRCCSCCIASTGIIWAPGPKDGAAARCARRGGPCTNRDRRTSASRGPDR